MKKADGDGKSWLMLGLALAVLGVFVWLLNAAIEAEATKHCLTIAQEYINGKCVSWVGGHNG